MQHAACRLYPAATLIPFDCVLLLFSFALVLWCSLGYTLSFAVISRRCCMPFAVLCVRRNPLVPSPTNCVRLPSRNPNPFTPWRIRFLFTHTHTHTYTHTHTHAHAHTHKRHTLSPDGFPSPLLRWPRPLCNYNQLAELLAEVGSHSIAHGSTLFFPNHERNICRPLLDRVLQLIISRGYSPR